MDKTIIERDEPLTKSGVREGWSINVHAGPDANTDTVIDVSITSPTRERITLRHAVIPPSLAEDEVKKGWTLALTEVEARRGK
jgi:hypothetical protein